jgi:predicted nucleic acid-binding Zn ribbon protein
VSDPFTAPSPRAEGVAKRQDVAMLGSPVCLACKTTIPRPRRGQRACSPRCRWRLWKAGRPTERQAGRAGLLLLRAQGDGLLARLDRRR